MSQSVYSKIINQLRLETGMNQAQIANLLEVSQATISRIEKDLSIPRGKLAEKIRALPIKSQAFEEIKSYDKEKKEFDLNKEVRTLPFRPFDISYLSLGYSRVNGDLCLTKKLSQEKALLFLADCVGHGPDAGKMAFAIRFGIESMLGVLNSSLISTTTITTSLNNAIDATHEVWAGPPAFVSGLLDTKQNQLRVQNNLQPPPILFANGEIKDINSLSSDPASQVLRHEEVIVNMKSGSSLLFCSDGLVDLFEGSQAIRDRFLKSAKAFKGDSKAILNHVMTGAKGVSKDSIMDGSFLSDDTSIMIITRGRD